MRIYIEDRDGQPLTDFIGKSLGYDVIPMETNHELEDLILGFDDIIFYDVSPDNSKTVQSFIRLRGLYGSRVKPVPCSEFAMLFVILNNGYQLNDLDRHRLLKSISGECVEYPDASYEKFCKRLLGEFGMKCAVNNRPDKSTADMVKRIRSYYYYDRICTKPRKRCIDMRLDRKYSVYRACCPGLWNDEDIVELYRNLFNALSMSCNRFLSVMRWSS